MKIALPALKNSMDAEIDDRFGRAKGFIVFDTDTGTFEWVSNQQSINSPQGAGIQSAKNVIDTGADVLIASNVGPKAYSVLKSAGIEVYLCGVKPISQIISEYKEGKLQKASAANVESHW